MNEKQYRKLAIAAVIATFTAFISSIIAYVSDYGRIYAGYAFFWLLMFLLDIYLLKHPPRLRSEKDNCKYLEELTRIIAGLEDKYSMAKKASRLLSEGLTDKIRIICGENTLSLLNRLLEGDESIREKLVEALDNCYSIHCREAK